MKSCSTCAMVKPLTDFYKHKQCADGHRNECKKCCNSKSNEYRKTSAGKNSLAKSRQQESYKLRREKFHQSDAGKLSRKRGMERWAAANPKHRQANTKLSNAIKLGWIKREPCFICGEPRADGHHADYDNPLGVTWLCRPHHLEVHIMHRQMQSGERK